MMHTNSECSSLQEVRIGIMLKIYSACCFRTGGSGVLNKTVIAPLERIKILYQIQGMLP
jgi:hypothetical protein